MIEIILNLIVSHAGEIGTFLVTSLVALLKRWLDKKSIKDQLLAKGLSSEEVKQII